MPSLPSYQKPPVVEVVLGVQFEPLRALRSTDIGHLYEVYKDEHPNISEHRPLKPTFEFFGKSNEYVQDLSFVLGHQTELPRIWFMSEDALSLVQFQRDRFIYNWRKYDNPETPYVRYPEIKKIFLDRYQRLNNFLHKHEKNQTDINQIEITYINHIKVEDSVNDTFCKTFRYWNPEPQNSPLGKVETQKFLVTYLLYPEKNPDTPHGRLKIHTDLVVSPDGEQYIQLALNVFGKPEKTDLDGIVNFMDEGREAIVKAFADITTEEAHKIWGVENVTSK